MPIIGHGSASTGTINAPVSYNVSEYSHSGVFTITRATVVRENAPPLVTRWEAPSECRDRWMLVDNGDDTTTLGNTTFVQTRTTIIGPPLNPNVTTMVTFVSPPSPRGASPLQGAVVVINKRQAREPEGSLTTRFRYTAWSIDSDPLFKSCQPYNAPPLYSPGICPSGQQVVEVTEIHAYQTNGGVKTSWQASCCSSGMTFGSDVSRFCQSTISSPLAAHALITTSYSGESSTTEVYEAFILIGDTLSTISSLTSLATGLAVADAVVVAWDLPEMISFPPDYRTSLANRIGVSVTPTATPAPSPSLPTQTGNVTPTPDAPLSTGAKAGIGVGVVLGAAVIVGIIILLWLRRRKRGPAVGLGQAVAEMEDQDGTHAKKRWFFGGRWRNEAEVRPTLTQELDSKAVRLVPGPPVELDSAEVRHDEAVHR